MKRPYIRAWALALVGKVDNFTLAQEALAEVENAPVDATFRNEGGTWSTLGEIVPLDLFTAVEQLGAEEREREG